MDPIYDRDRKQFPIVKEWHTEKFLDVGIIVDSHIDHLPYGLQAHSVIIKSIHNDESPSSGDPFR